MADAIFDLLHQLQQKALKEGTTGPDVATDEDEPGEGLLEVRELFNSRPKEGYFFPNFSFRRGAKKSMTWNSKVYGEVDMWYDRAPKTRSTGAAVLTTTVRLNGAASWPDGKRKLL